MKAFDIVGYTFDADNYHGRCLVEMLVHEGHLSPAAVDMDPEAVFDQDAAASAIDRQDESSFDSGDFPKVIFSSQVEDDEHCGRCGGLL